ncbi:hypothetical protein [Nodosilinea sp. P-1105]|uniref:hypothetical protein n=1 Tax=Nodosilinea sp. P-1105 TaxID=2546229 RepID=UPI00146CA121|nr:hypothetical protein [Nodosilinea sp. P-1105]NMF85066.1 hypothetical protein [Nodosilinea sp. P-1105]
MTTCYWPIHTPHLPQQGLGTWISNAWQAVLAQLNCSTEPRVWSTHTAKELLWNAYDPITGETIHFATENELRTWLEDLHYRDQAIARQQQEKIRIYWNKY